MRKHILLPTILIICLCLSPLSILGEEADGTSFVSIFDQTFSGYFDGKNTFSRDDDNNSFTMTCKWKNNKPDGEAVITYADGSVLSATYTDGLIEGPVLKEFPDGSQISFSCVNGIPSGLVTRLDSDGTPVSYDNYYQGLLVSDLISQSTESDYHRLYVPGYYSVRPTVIHGTVEGILDSQTSETLILKDSDSHYYVLQYDNSTFEPYSQGIIPCFHLAESITAYGFFQKTDVFNLAPSKDSSKYETEDVYGLRRLPTQKTTSALSGTDALVEQLVDSLENQSPADDSSTSTQRNPKDHYNYTDNVGVYQNNTLPIFMLFYAEAETVQNPDRTKLSYGYDEIIHFPYLYAGMSAELTGTILQASYDYDKNTVYFTIEEDESNDQYLSEYFFTKTSFLPVIGDHVRVEGTWYGLSKILTTSERPTGTQRLIYTLYPCVLAQDISNSPAKAAQN